MAGREEKILIVDDDGIIRRLLTKELSGEGYQCQEAGSAEEALARTGSVPFDLILLDVNMPDKSGIELLPEIKDKYPDTPIIMITAISDVETAIKAIRAGAYDYIIKPTDPEILNLSINRALDKRRLILENKSYQLHLEEKVKEQTRKIRASFLNAISALAYALEANDKYTSGHSQRVTETAVALARELNISQENIDKIRLVGLIHDIGKIGIRESILNKPGKLTDEEFQHIKSHPETGERILIPIIGDKEVLDMVRHHHERYGGRGYPDGLEAAQIPLGARILAVADTYDAMTSDRPYREAMSIEAACGEVERCRGSQFDPEIVDAFLNIKKCVTSAI